MIPVPLAEPKVQAYLDPVNGACAYTGCVSPAQDRLIGANLSDHYCLFDFTAGTFLSGQIMSAIGVSVAFRDTPRFAGAASLTFWSDKDNDDNAIGLALVDPTTGPPWTVDSTWGVGGSGFNPPNNIPYMYSQTYLTMGATHWLVQGQFFNGSITVTRADAPGSIGFWGHYYLPAGGGGSPSVCSGPQSGSSATAYWTSTQGAGLVQTLGKTVIVAGADGYVPSTWPTPNLDISSSVIKAYAPTDFDPAWAAISTLSGPAYDQTDGHLIITVSGSGGGNPAYVAKVNSSTGAVIWKIAVTSTAGFDNRSICLSRIVNGIFLYLCPTGIFTCTMHAIDTSTGIDYPTNFSGVNVIDPISDDVLGCVIGSTSWNTGSGSIVLLNATPASGDTLGAVYLIAAPVGVGAAFADTQFLGDGA